MKPADEGNTAIRGYKIERSADDGSGNSDGNWEVLEDDTGTTATTYDDEGLGHGETYHYRVSAFNSDSAGPVSNVADATIDIRGPVPQSASVTASGTALTIVFDETLEAAPARLPAAARFRIAAADGAEIAIGTVSVSATDVDPDVHERLRRHPHGPGGDGGPTPTRTGATTRAGWSRTRSATTRRTSSSGRA